jgi:DNA-binding Lrp family transcriptional regulator
MTANEQKLIELIQEGIPLVEEPFKEIAERLSTSEDWVIDTLKKWKDEEIIRRFGVVVRHRKLGYTANAMCVWDIPDDQVSALGKKMQEYSFVNLCYRRPRRKPDWPYNLFAMVHGKEEAAVREQIAVLNNELGLKEFSHDVLFSKECFKQRGAKYVSYKPDAIDLDLINELQHGLEVVDQPYLKLAKKHSLSEEAILERIEKLLENKFLSRFGPMFNVERFGGAFSLVAMKVPEERFEEVSEMVNSFTEVAHNYEREHLLNMWFVLATENKEEISKTLKAIEEKTGLETFNMPKLKEFYLELKLTA